jgi:hypothetical protein
MNTCKCVCHWCYGIIYVLGFAAALLFIWTSLAGVKVLGLVSADYFMWAVILLLLSRSGKMCHKCSAGHGIQESNTCSHMMGCKCGDCDRCK